MFLTEDDVRRAKLKFADLKDNNVATLERWFACRNLKISGRKDELFDRLCVRLNLSRKDPNYIAILIHMMKTDHDNALDWPFSGRLSIVLIHPNDPTRNIKEIMMTHPGLDAFKQPVQNMNPKGFGYTEFALLDIILNEGYLKDNHILIKVIAQPV